MPPPVRVAVLGAGAFGRNHLRVYHELQQADPARVQLAAAVDASPATRDEAASRYGIPVFPSVEALLASGTPIHAASVCVPTIHHAAVATALLHAGIDVLIEKPFAATLLEADHVIALAASLGRIVQIGHLERFNPAVTAVQPLLHRPMFFESHRLSVFTPRSLDVDVVLDLMIHDLDIVLQLAASPVREIRAVGLPVLSRKVDIANVRVEFDSGCVANFTASRISTEQVRKLRFFQPHQYLSLDFARQELLTIDVAPEALQAATSPEALAALQAATSPAALAALATASSASTEVSSRPKARSAEVARPAVPTANPGTPSALQQTHPSPGFSLQKVPTHRAEPLRLELENFLDACLTRTPPRVTAEQGRAALSLALEINAAIADHAHRAGL